MSISRHAEQPRRADPHRASPETAICRVPGCGGALRFYTIEFGRVVDVCTECERRIAYVRALEAAVRKAPNLVAMPKAMAVAIIEPAKRSRQRATGVIKLLAKSPRLTVAGIMERLGTTRISVTQHLFYLRRDKLVIAKRDPAYMGRGWRCIYSLSAKGLRLRKVA